MFEQIRRLALENGLKALRFGEENAQIILPSGIAVTGVWNIRDVLRWLQHYPT